MHIDWHLVKMLNVLKHDAHLWKKAVYFVCFHVLICFSPLWESCTNCWKSCCVPLHLLLIEVGERTVFGSFQSKYAFWNRERGKGRGYCVSEISLTFFSFDDRFLSDYLSVSFFTSACLHFDWDDGSLYPLLLYYLKFSGH